MRVVVVGGGPAGMIAAITAAKSGDEVYLLEKNSRLGKKLLITGKGRCNLTSSLPISEFIKNIPGNGKFMYSAFKNYTNEDIISFMENNGVKVKEERGNRIFPQSDKSLDVLNVFERELRRLSVKILLNTKVTDIEVKDGKISTVKYQVKTKFNAISKMQMDEKDNNIEANKKIENNTTTNTEIEKNIENKILKADKIIIATGGRTYSATGSTGDGYELAKKLGHTITKIKPSLVPLTTLGNSFEMCKKLQGLSLKNVRIEMIDTEKNKIIYDDFGEMLFTHFGVSGPTILSSSAHLLRYDNVEKLLKSGKVVLKIDLKPALTIEKLDLRILRDFEKNKNKEFKNSLDELLPKKLIDVVVKLSGIDENKKVNSITKEERRKLASLLKCLKIKIDGFRPLDEGIITSGGIDVKEIDPKTMESKIVRGLYFAGEVIDVDAYTGGFNLQIAYSSGYVAGSHGDYWK